MEQEYKGWLVSNSFLKRSFAVMGHYFVASLIITVPVWIIMVIVILSIGTGTK